MMGAIGSIESCIIAALLPWPVLFWVPPLGDLVGAVMSQKQYVNVCDGSGPREVNDLVCSRSLAGYMTVQFKLG